MRESILLFVFFCSFLFSDAQSVTTAFNNSNSLLDTGNLWSILEYDESFSPDHLNPTLKTKWLKAGGDTIINSIDYTIMLSSSDENHEYWELENFLREDNNRVYRYEPNKEERLLYDFNMNSGDSIFYSIPSGDIITRVDSIKDTLMNNVSYKQYFLSVYQYSGTSLMLTHEKWIEVIGSNWGLNRTFNEFATGSSVSYSLNCFYKEGVQLYQSSKYNECYYDEILLSSATKKQKLDIEILPGSSCGKFLVGFGKPLNDLKLDVFNLNGMLIRSYFIKNSPDAIININGEKPGLYIIKIENNNFLSTKKIILSN